MSQDLLYHEVYPEIYRIYDKVLDKLYPENLNITQKYAYLQQLQEPTRKLHQKYLNPEKQHIEVDYTDLQIQEAYILRYSIPHALQLPWVLEVLRARNFHHLDNNLTASLFGGGPCPEILGIRCYLNRILPNRVNISAARLDRVTNWGVCYHADTFFNFRSDLAGNGSDLLNSASREWVEKSDLIVIQNCLNEIPDLVYPQLLMNMKHIVNIMKPGALMLIIEKRYSNVKRLLREFHPNLDNIQTHYTAKDEIDIKYLNYNSEYVPDELIKHLFLRVFDSGLWLANRIKFQWLAISKQIGFYDHYAGINVVPSTPEALMLH